MKQPLGLAYDTWTEECRPDEHLVKHDLGMRNNTSAMAGVAKEKTRVQQQDSQKITIIRNQGWGHIQ